MPEGVSTRMMILSGKIDRLSISIYGFTLLPASAPGKGVEDSISEELGLDQDGIVSSGNEDWSWASEWAGGVEGLLGMLYEDFDVSRHQKETAMSCLELLMETDITPSILEQVLDHPTALSYLLLLPSYPPQRILQRLFEEPKYALHPNLRHHLPPTHPLRQLVHGSEEERRTVAWARLPHEGGLMMLQELGVGHLVTVDKASGLSRMARLVEVLERWEGSWDGYEMGLDLLLEGIGNEWSANLARKIPPLIVTSSLRGSTRELDIPKHYSMEVLTALLNTAPIIDGRGTFHIVSTLASPYLLHLRPSDPLVQVFTVPNASPAPLVGPTTPGSRQLHRFSQSLHSPINAFVHELTPKQLLEALAPELLASLSSAREPAFGLSPSKTAPGNNDTTSASAFAGKVYSSHEFRTRQNAAIHTAGASSGLGTVEVGYGLGAGSRMDSRPASRHVDDYLDI
jgi:hypothetical protein